MEEMQQHQGEWFFLHELNVDKVFSTIQRADYLILYYIKVAQEAHPGEKLYLADLAAAMGLRVTELSKGIEKLQDSGFVTWKTDREAGRHRHPERRAGEGVPGSAVTIMKERYRTAL